MKRERRASRVLLPGVLLAVIVGLAACYKDAGENLPPTSRQVNVLDITPTTPAPPTQAFTATPEEAVLATPTRHLVPTTTPSGAVQAELPPTVTPVSGDSDALPATPTNLPIFQPTFTAQNTVVPTATVMVITTPVMSDIKPSLTPSPTIDPSKMPTPTDIPVELNPCIHVVVFGDTLYSIARDNDVSIDDLVAANPSLLGGNPNTILRLGWQLRLPLPDCQMALSPTAPSAELLTSTPGSTGTPGGPLVHVVQPGEGVYAIARKYGVSPEAIIQANNLANPNLIYPGQELIIPTGQ